MLTREQNETLTRVGPGTPMGELLRRYWHPVAATSELERGARKAVRLLGQDLVLFRTTLGELGLLDERCPHRGVSLASGFVDAEGIRCPYHGWKFDEAGRCLELPGEPNRLVRIGKLRTAAYGVEELGGLVFAYIGPEPRPLLPRFDVLVWEDALRDVGQATLPCNWLQIMENSVDPLHVEWLHGHHLRDTRRAAAETTPTHYARRHARIGFDVFRHGIVKRRVLEGGSEQDDDWRLGHPLVFPNALRVGSHGQHRLQVRVPIDDENTKHYWYTCYRAPVGNPAPVQSSIPLYDVPWRDEQGNFIVDFVDGGDIMAWVSQGRIAARDRETLVPSDEGVVLLRKLYLEQLELIGSGNDPLGVLRDPRENELIELPQETQKFGASADFLRQSIEMGHARYSPLKDVVLDWLGLSGE